MSEHLGERIIDLRDDSVFSAIRNSVLEVLPDLDPELVAPHRSLTDLGCNSIDRADVVTLSMEELGVSIPVSEFGEVHNIGTLAELLRRHTSGG